MPNKLVEFEMTAVIPVAQYANIQPVVKTTGKTFEEARDLALEQIQSIWNQTGEKPVQLVSSAPVAANTAITGQVKYEKKRCAVSKTEVLFDPIAHKYVDGEGNKYLSGSAFADKFKKPFARDEIAKVFATKHGVDVDDVLAMWQLNGETSTSFGTSIHNGLELYGKYLELSKKTKGTSESALHSHPIIRDIVESFYEGREEEDAFYEVFVANGSEKLCGFIDRLLSVDRKKKIVRVQDYKTNPDIRKAATILPPFKGVVENNTLGAYWLQLSFYGYILESHGYTVEGLDIFHHDGEKWTTYSREMIDIKAGL